MATAREHISNIASSTLDKSRNAVDRFVPPRQRSELLERIRLFARANPRLAAFIAINAILTGGPLVLFTLFALSIFTTALVVALTTALLAALFFSLFAIGFALVFLLPTVFFTTLTATFVFAWGLVGWTAFSYLEQRQVAQGKGETFGDRLNVLSGRRLDYVVESARQGTGTVGGVKDVKAEGMAGLSSPAQSPSVSDGYAKIEASDGEERKQIAEPVIGDKSSPA